MAHNFDPAVGYTYSADIYCPACIVDVLRTRADLLGAYPPGFDTEEWLNRCAEILHIDREDERSFDSGDFPKVVFRDQLDGDHCGACGERLEATE